MRAFSGLAKTALLALTMGSSYGTVTTYVGNAYGGSGVRANFLTLMPTLTYDNVDLATECTSPCGYSFNRLVTGSGSTPGPLVNVSGQSISGVTFAGANSGAAGNALYIRPIRTTDGTRNQGNGPNYNQLNSAAANYLNVLWPQWVIGFATASGVTGAPSMTMTLPTGTRSVAFDYGSINAPASSFTITATTASGSTQLPAANTYAVGTSYNTSGPGFYGATSTEDILTLSIVANASSSQWIVNLANFRVGVQINAPVPEPGTQLTLAVALIAFSWLLRRKRRKIALGGIA